MTVTRVHRVGTSEGGLRERLLVRPGVGGYRPRARDSRSVDFERHGVFFQRGLRRYRARGHATGLFRYVEVLDAERTLFAARRELLVAGAAFHFAAIDIERLTATALAELSRRNTP